MPVLIVVEHHHSKLAGATLSLITAALQLAQPVRALVAGKNCEQIVAELQAIAGIEEILVADHDCYQHDLPESWAELIAEVARSTQSSHVLAPATTFGKNILPRAAALLNVGQVSDIIKIVDANTYQRPIYAGNAIATVRSHDSIQVITVRPTAFALATKGAKTMAKVTPLSQTFAHPQISFVREEQHVSERPELTSAEVVISGGRGLGDKATFERLTAIADSLHAAIGASRAAVDAGLAPNDWQVGQTGKVVAPKLYIAIGISGAIQHLAGMKESKIIVAINKDPDAPIFQIADYGLVADLHDVLNEWEKYLKT